MIHASVRSYFLGVCYPATALVLLLGLGGCAKSSDSPAAGGGRGGRGGGGAAPVLVGQVQRKIVPLVIDAIGAVEPIRNAAVRAQITGALFKIDIKEGQDVKAGDLLFEIDPRPFQNALAVATADLQKSKVQLETARAQVARYTALIAESMVSKEQFQQIQDAARALEAQVASGEAAVANAKLQLEYCSIRAPISGRTGNLGVHEGDLVRASDATTVLVTINQLSPIYVTFGVPQQHLPLVNRYRSEGTLAVSVAPPGIEQRPEKGELTFVDNMVDPTTGTIKLKATFPNDDHQLWPGLFTNVTVTLSTPEVVTVPASAVQTDQTGQHVFVVKADQTAEFRPVTIERTLDDTAVVTKGLADGETVVTDGQLRVTPGGPVQIKTNDSSNVPAGNHGGAGERAKGKKGKRQDT
jgi:membrane fusion protein, multidrug efflux system